MQPNVYFSKTQGPSTPAEVKQMKGVPYDSAAGSIMYVVRCTRPDGVFSQNLTSRYQQNPRESHWTDTVYVFMMNGGAVDWKSSKQSTTAMSFTKAEYRTASKAAMENNLDT
nr:hypothetical protein [Tanacetum cinerariifolium]